MDYLKVKCDLQSQYVHCIWITDLLDFIRSLKITALETMSYYHGHKNFLFFVLFPFFFSSSFFLWGGGGGSIFGFCMVRGSTVVTVHVSGEKRCTDYADVEGSFHTCF